MSNAVLAVKIYIVTKESIPVCDKTTCMYSFTQVIPSFSGGGGGAVMIWYRFIAVWR